MANRKVQVDILANPQGFTKGVGQASKDAQTLADRLNKLGPVGKGLAGVLNNLGLSSLTTAQGLAGLGLTAGALTVGFLEKAIDRYVDLAGKIRNYSLVTGQSAEASSRQVQAFQELGIGEDVAASGMVKLSKAIETTPKKLAAVGVEVAKDSAGNVDLNATLLNVIGAYQGTEDAAKRNEIALAAFGKGGAALIPILETDRAELKALQDQVGKVYTQKDLDAARNYSIQQEKLHQNFGDFVASVGQAVTGPLGDLFQNTNAETYAMKRVNEMYQQGKISHDEYNAAISDPNNNKLVQNLEAEYKAAQTAKAGVDALNQAHKDAAAAALAEADAENKLYDALDKNQSAAFAYEQAQIDLRRAQEAAAKVEADSTASGLDKEEALLREKEAYIKVANAAVDYGEKQAEVNGQTLTAAQKADIYRANLQALENELSPNDPLRKDLQGYIDELNSIPSAKSTTISDRYVSAGGGTGLTFDDGGVVPGPAGAPVPAIVHGGEVVLNKAQQAALGGNASQIHIHIEGYYSDGPGLDRLVNAIARRMGYATGR